MLRHRTYTRTQHATAPLTAFEKKRIFFIFALLALLLLIAAGFLACYLSWPRLAQFHPVLPVVISLVIGGLIFVISLVLITMIVSAALERDLRFHWGERMALLSLLPLAMTLARLFKISKDRVRNSFVNVNNALVRAVQRSIKPEDLLLLLPRCLQNTECPNRVTEDVHLCQQCGKCPLARLVQLEKQYGFVTSIVTGGGLARRKVAEVQPKAIVAVACEYEMVTGMQDVLKIPVIGVLNQRPEGPCRNTRVDIAEVEDAVRFLSGLNSAQ